MGPDRNILNSSSAIVLTGDASSDKQALALDALTKLANQFSDRPELDQLVRLLVLTLSGQFSVASAFVLFRSSGKTDLDPLYFAQGKFSNSTSMKSIELSDEVAGYFVQNRFPQLVEAFNPPQQSAALKRVLSNSGVRVIAPLVHNNQLLGILGLGNKVTQHSFAVAELEVLAAIVNTIVPFVANSFLFVEISALNRWYLGILNSVRHGMFVFDAENRIKKVNAAGFLILKTFRSNLNRIDDLYQMPMDLVFPDSVFRGWTERFSGIESIRSERLFENMTAGANGTERIYNIRVSRIEETSSNGSDLIITLDDITGQKESEQRLFDLEKYAEKGLMASSISHELKNFLGLIMGGVELAQRAISVGNSDRLEYTMSKLKDNVAQMDRFTSGLMDYSRLNTVTRLADVNEVITDVVSFISLQKRFRDTTITINLHPVLPKIEIDPDQIAQLLINFLNNANDAIVEAGKARGTIEVSTLLEDNSVKMLIRDNGAGIPPEVKERLFVDRQTTKKTGHGYGLITCGRIIANHNASVDVATEAGNGTTFTITFPITAHTLQKVR